MTTSFTTAFSNLITKLENNFIWLKTQVENLVTSVGTKASATDLTTHTGNTTVHITSTERDTWNGKQDALGSTLMGYINAVPNKADSSDLLNYYTKTETNNLLTNKLRKEVVNSLPAVADAEENVIYLVPNSGSESGNVKDEYVLINGTFELMGTTQVDLSGYYQISVLDSSLSTMFTTGAGNITDLTANASS